MKPETGGPAYLELHGTGELEERADRAYRFLHSCTVCPRKCGAARLEDRRGYCRTGLLPVIASCGPHFGEETPLVGRGGSGTIFVTHCSMACCFCQNYAISRLGHGGEVAIATLAAMMIRLQKAGCHNINIVTPTHIAPQLIRAVSVAAGQGLSLPIVYNSGGYDSVETLRLLDGIVDIYMPDAKFGNNGIAAMVSGIPDYVSVSRDAIREMHRQVGDLVIRDGIAVRGLLVRHLVLPANLAGSDQVLPWLADEISQDTYVNIMDQYHWPTSTLPPEDFPDLGRPITGREYAFAMRVAHETGLHRGF